jgi:hypothetical protein
MTTLSTKDFANFVVRTAEACEMQHRLQITMTYKEWIEHIGLVPLNLDWKKHFPVTKGILGRLLLTTAEIERANGRDGAAFISRIVDGKTGKPTGRAYLAMLARQSAKTNPPLLADDEDE